MSSNKSNRVFNLICTALNLSTEQRLEWLQAAGHAVTKGKLTAWGSRGKKCQELPTEILDDFLAVVEDRAKSPLIEFFAEQLYGRDYERLRAVDIAALEELVALMRREYSYSPANLRHECSKVGGRAAFAGLHGIPPTTLDKWCRELSDANHNDMPLKKWQEIIKE